MGLYWQLNKDVQISVALPAYVDATIKAGFIATLLRYAEEMSAMHTYNMAERLKRYFRDTGEPNISVAGLINWRASLKDNEQWQLGGLKGFLLAWHEYGFGGIPEDVVELLHGWRIAGNEKGAAVTGGCPETGPYTDLEMQAVLDWANAAVTRKELEFEDYTFLLTIAMTARRTVQIAALRGKDLLKHTDKGSANYRLNMPRAKQRGMRFRSTFRSVPILEDLYLLLLEQHKHSVAAVSKAVGEKLSVDLVSEVPIFLNKKRLEEISDPGGLSELLVGGAPDRLHARTASLRDGLGRCARASTARSERTGDFIRLSARRFRHTRGTKLRREGFGAFVIAELLDHSDVQNVSVYTENTAQEAVIINEFVGAQLAPFAQACMGKLVHSEREAIRGDDIRSRVPNQHQDSIGTCGNYGFCASGYKACYTCFHFQPWLHGPHEDVLSDLYMEKRQARDAGCAEGVINANDRLILAVEHCISLCKQEKERISRQTALEVDVNG